MKKLVSILTVLMVLSSCQKEEFGLKYSVKSGVITITFTDGHVFQMTPITYAKLVLENEQLNIVPNPNCPISVQTSQLLSWTGVRSFKVTSEEDLECK